MHALIHLPTNRGIVTIYNIHTVLLVKVTDEVSPHAFTKGHIVGTFLAAVAGQDTKVVVLPSTTEVNEPPDDADSDVDGAAAGAPVGELATTVIPLAGVVQLKGVTNVGCSFVARFLSQVAL